MHTYRVKFRIRTGHQVDTHEVEVTAENAGAAQRTIKAQYGDALVEIVRTNRIE
jgi:hypothetical protein